jgi:hypothetical protein
MVIEEKLAQLGEYTQLKAFKDTQSERFDLLKLSIVLILIVYEFLVKLRFIL